MVSAVITPTYYAFVPLDFFPERVFTTREDETHGDDNKMSRLARSRALPVSECRLLSRYRDMASANREVLICRYKLRVDEIEQAVDG